MAALSYSSFIVRFPEFAALDQPLVEGKLAEASVLVIESVWGELHQVAHSYMAAHLLAVSPFGQRGRLDPKTPGSTYKLAFDAIAMGLPRRALVADDGFYG